MSHAENIRAAHDTATNEYVDGAVSSALLLVQGELDKAEEKLTASEGRLSAAVARATAAEAEVERLSGVVVAKTADLALALSRCDAANASASLITRERDDARAALLATQDQLAAANVRIGQLAARVTQLEATMYDVQAGGDIQAVVNSKPAGAIIRLQAGVYPIAGSGLAPKAQQELKAVGGRAELRGDITLKGWVANGANWYVAGALPAAYQDTAAQCEVNAAGQNSCRVREQVWYDGIHLTRVMSQAEVTADTFYQDYTGNRVYIGRNPEGHTVEMSKTRHAMNTDAPGVKLRGLRFRRFATPAQLGAVVVRGSDWEVDDCQFDENHAIGLHLSEANRAFVHHNTFARNGQLGLGHHRSVDTRIEDNAVEDNNTDGFWGGDWESGGIKITYSTRVSVKRNIIRRNKGVGLWFDIDNLDYVASQNTITDNYADGVRAEIGFAGEIFDNDIRGNAYGFAKSGGRGADYSLFATGAININTSVGVHVHGNRVGPNQNGIVAQKRNRGTSPTYNVMWDLYDTNVHDNIVELTSGTLYGEGVCGLGALQQTDATPYFDARKNNRFHHNQYILQSLSAAKFAWSGKYLTLSAAQALGSEVGSTAAVKV